MSTLWKTAGLFPWCASATFARADPSDLLPWCNMPPTRLTSPSLPGLTRQQKRPGRERRTPAAGSELALVPDQSLTVQTA
jgi:hypothetical protein